MEITNKFYFEYKVCVFLLNFQTFEVTFLEILIERERERGIEKKSKYDKTEKRRNGL